MHRVDRINVKIESKIWSEAEHISLKHPKALKIITLPLLISLLALDIFTQTAKCFETLMLLCTIQESRKEHFVELLTNIFLYPLALVISFIKTLIVVYKFAAWKTAGSYTIF